MTKSYPASESSATDGEMNGKRGIELIKGRGTGTGKFLLNKKDNQIRFLVRADKTHKVIINHVVKRMGKHIL